MLVPSMYCVTCVMLGEIPPTPYRYRHTKGPKKKLKKKWFPVLCHLCDATGVTSFSIDTQAVLSRKNSIFLTFSKVCSTATLHSENTRALNFENLGPCSWGLCWTRWGSSRFQKSTLKCFFFKKYGHWLLRNSGLSSSPCLSFLISRRRAP